VYIKATYLVEFAIPAGLLQLLQHRLITQRKPICSPDAWIGATGINLVANREVVIMPSRLVSHVVFIPFERRCEILVANPLEQIPHCSKRIIENDIHAPAVHLGDEGPPVFDMTMVVIEESEVEGAEPITTPRHVDERRARQIDSLHVVSSIQNAR